MIHINEKVTSTSIKVWATNLQSRDIITDVLGDAKANYHWESPPIDGKCVSLNIIKVNRCRYLPFAYFISDHCLLWIDVFWIGFTRFLIFLSCLYQELGNDCNTGMVILECQTNGTVCIRSISLTRSYVVLIFFSRSQGFISSHSPSSVWIWFYYENA